MKSFLVFITIVAVILISERLCYSTHYWVKTFGGGEWSWEDAESLQQTKDGGYVVAGWTHSRFWVMRLTNAGDVLWEKTYGGGSFSDHAKCIQETTDGGYVVVGNRNGASSDPFMNDVLIIKLSRRGNIIWHKTFGRNNGLSENVNSIQETKDGGYVVAGSSGSNSSRGLAWVMKLNRRGNIVWQKSYGDTRSYDTLNSIQETKDGGYVVAGIIYPWEEGGSDAWVMKLNRGGNIVWQKSYRGGDFYEGIASIQETKDGNYVVAGSIKLFDFYDEDSLVLKLDRVGNVIWQKSFGGSDSDWASSIQETTDGGYVITGATHSFGAGERDLWLIKLENDGGLIWQKTYGGEGFEYGSSIQETTDGGYIVAGRTGYSFNPYKSFADAFLLKLDSNGNIPNCDIIQTSNAIIIDTTVSVKNVNAIAMNASISVEVTDITQQDSSATITTVCEAEVENNCPSETIYGTDSTETELLRSIRDNVLSKSQEGQELIKLYYQWSPMIVQAMEEDEEFKQEVKDIVDEVLELMREEN